MKKHTIMIIDDQEINRRILGRLLEDKYEILYAENGKEALDLLHTHSDVVAAVLLDIVMPVMDGYAVLEAMKNNRTLSKIPVIVSTQSEDSQTEVRALSQGAQDYITKPYKADVIRHRLENIIRFRETAAMINKVKKDELTGLYNKQFFNEMVREKLKSMPDEKFDILCIGVERFKLINEVYGEKKGDAVLCHIADVLRDTCRTYNICSRFLGDIFYSLIPHVENRGNEVIRQMYRKVNEFPIDMNIKLHAGIYTITDRDMPVVTMCDRAKTAANENRGKYDIYFTEYDDSIRQRLMEEQFISSSMASALEEHQFQIYYQPKYDLNTEAIAGAEALVRWIHPQRGFLSPGAFIPIFERNGFITQLDFYVWETVCKDVKKWIDSGNSPVAVSVNVSRIDLFNPQLPDILQGLITKYNIPQKYVHLEITESAYAENTDQFVTIVGKLRQLGFIIEMDDFGSGYSSLNILAEMPVDILKLDMKFVQNQSESKSKKGILGFVISLAKWMNLSVVAEGVETEEQIEVLRSMGCNYVQGFYYAKPMPKSEFEALLQKSITVEMR
ncbi:MAG: EAL domain-containing response regulator [Clostridia bacterium]|nr:EAL domain-containing response regulator [Clostridia bacterium]NCC43794.1 EAL domain-containing response regulator [Clostridia bacterium]